jgi:hypothetical protein
MTGPRQATLTREELRLLLLDTGRTLLIEEGLGTGIDTLTFKRVFERVEADTGRRISNASVIRRVWENLADYQADVLVTIASQDGLGEFHETFTALAPVFASIDLSSAEARERSVREVCRVGGAANILALLESPHWSLWIAVWALATAENLQPDGQRLDHQLRIRQALLEGYEGTTRLWEDAYDSLVQALGLRPRAPLTVRQFTVTVGALAEGCSLRQRLDPDMDGILRPTGPDGEDQEWSVFAIGLEALQRLYFEPDPDWTPGPRAAAVDG